MFDANYQSRLIAAALIEADFAAHLADVCSERGIRVPSYERVYRGIVPAADRNANERHYLEIGQPEGRVAVDASITSENEMWILGTVTQGTPETVDTEATAYLTALARTFASGEGKLDTVPYRYEMTGYSTSPPNVETNTSKQSVGVQVVMQFIE